MGDYFSTKSTWNDAHTKNIPSIFNGVETKGVESVDEEVTVTETVAKWLDTANVGYATTPAINMYGALFDFSVKLVYTEKSTDLNILSNSSASPICRLRDLDTIVSDPYNATEIAFTFPTDAIDGDLYEIEVNRTSTTSISAKRTNITAGTATETVTKAIEVGDRYGFNEIGSRTTAFKSVDIMFDMYLKSGATTYIDAELKDNLNNSGTLTLTNKSLTFDKNYSYDEIVTLNTYALMASRLVAEGDGVSAYLDAGVVNICGTGASSLIYEAKISQMPTVATGFISSEYLSGGNARGWAISYNMANDRVSVVLGKSDGTYADELIIDAVGLAVGVTLRVEIEASGSDLVTEVFVDNVSQGTDTLVGQNVIYSNGAMLVFFAYQNGATGFSDIGMYDQTIIVDGVEKLNCPLEGNVDDTSGNGNHLTNSGVDLLAVQEDMVNGVYSPALRKGFARGVEIVTNGDFETDTDWTKGVDATSGNNWTISGGRAIYTSLETTGSAVSIYQFVSGLTAGKVYKVSLHLTTPIGCRFAIAANIGLVPYADYTEDETIDVIVMATATTSSFIISASQTSGNFSIDNVTVKEAYIPRLDDLSGYANTVTEEHPALEKGCNNAPVKITFSSGLTGDIMDKSDDTLWSDDARSGTGYDSDNPRDWNLDELTPDIIQLWWVGTKNKIYTISQLNEYVYYNGVASWDATDGEIDTYPEDSTTQEGVLIYGTAKTEEEAVKIGKYIKNKIGEGNE